MHRFQFWKDLFLSSQRLSGWSPKYFDPAIVLHMSKLITEKFMFGTDFPFLHPAKWLSAFESLGVSEEVKKKVLRDNAVRVFRLT
ncbi:MAG: amidohydrolase family protein [Nitrososphaerales archaeon]